MAEPTLLQKFEFVRTQVRDPKLVYELSADFGSDLEGYRQQIRKTLSQNYAGKFSFLQNAKLHDLTWVPEAQEGFFSISHCSTLGGFTYSKLPHGFDLEVETRLKAALLERISTAEEIAQAPNSKFLWPAKEAAIKSFGPNAKLVLTDFTCSEWKSHSETQVASFRITSKKTLELNLNQGFVFSEKDILFALFFR